MQLTGTDRARYLGGHAKVSVKIDTKMFDVPDRGDIVRLDTYPKSLCHISLGSWDDWKDFQFGVIHL